LFDFNSLYLSINDVMKNNLFLVLAMYWLLSNLNAQTIMDSNFNSPLAADKTQKGIAKGKSAVYLYFGYNVLIEMYQSQIIAAGSRVIGSTSSGPVGGVYEYMIGDAIGIGVEFGYSKIVLKYTTDKFVGSKKVDGHDEQVTFTTFKYMARCNFHLLESKNTDLYGFFSLGYRPTQIDYVTNKTYFNGERLIRFNGITTMPIGFKAGTGIRHFFTKNIGIGAEFSIGTPIVSGGLNFRF
jgi:hypothetical protein